MHSKVLPLCSSTLSFLLYRHDNNNRMAKPSLKPARLRGNCLISVWRERGERARERESERERERETHTLTHIHTCTQKKSALGEKGERHNGFACKQVSNGTLGIIAPPPDAAVGKNVIGSCPARPNALKVWRGLWCAVTPVGWLGRKHNARASVRPAVAGICLGRHLHACVYVFECVSASLCLSLSLYLSLYLCVCVCVSLSLCLSLSLSSLTESI